MLADKIQRWRPSLPSHICCPGRLNEAHLAGGMGTGSAVCTLQRPGQSTSSRERSGMFPRANPLCELHPRPCHSISREFDVKSRCSLPSFLKEVPPLAGSCPSILEPAPTPHPPLNQSPTSCSRPCQGPLFTAISVPLDRRKSCRK